MGNDQNCEQYLLLCAVQSLPFLFAAGCFLHFVAVAADRLCSGFCFLSASCVSSAGLDVGFLFFL